MRTKKKRAIPESMRCSVCREYAVRMVEGVRPRTCVECVVWPPEPGDKRLAKPKGKSRGR